MRFLCRCDTRQKSLPEQFLLPQLFVVTTRLRRAAICVNCSIRLNGKRKNGSCRMLSCRVVSSMCELAIMQHVQVWSSRQNGSCRMLSCRVVSSMCELAIMQHVQVWSSRQKAAATKFALEFLSCVAATVSLKIAKENSFHINLKWVHKFMMQE